MFGHEDMTNVEELVIHQCFEERNFLRRVSRGHLGDLVVLPIHLKQCSDFKLEAFIRRKRLLVPMPSSPVPYSHHANAQSPSPIRLSNCSLL